MARVCSATLWSSGDAVPLKDRGDPPCEPGMFPARAEMEEGRESLPLLIPVFNEEAAELWRTLNNLLEQQRHVRRHTFEVCIALDGWSRASDSMKLYLLQLFPPTEQVVASAVVSQSSRCIPLADWSSPLRLGRISSPGEEPNRVTVVVDSVRPSDLRAKVPVPVHHPSSIILYFIVLTIPLLFSLRIAFLLGSLCESCSSGFLLLNFGLLVLFYLRHSWSSENWKVGMSYFGGMLAVASALQFFSRIAHIASFALKSWHSAVPPPSDVSGIAQALLAIPSFLIMYMVSPSRFREALRGIIPFLLVSPFLYGVLYNYSACLTWDLQWGNRPSDEMDFVTNPTSNRRIARSFRIISSCGTALLLLFQLALFLFIWTSPSCWDQIQRFTFVLFLLLVSPQLLLSLVQILFSRFNTFP